MDERNTPHHVSYYTRRTAAGYQYRTDAECSCGWSYSTHGEPLAVARRMGEQHLSSHILRRETNPR